jgi:polyhydroxyalkanoate synthesis regulator phasin
MARATPKVAPKIAKKIGSVSKVIQQAKESLKLLEALEKQTIQRAKTFVRNPLPPRSTRLTNERILTSLRALGIASRQEVRELAERVSRLEAEIQSLQLAAASTPRKPRAAKPATDVFPN